MTTNERFLANLRRKERFAKNLRRIMSDRRIVQQKLASELEISEQTLRNWRFAVSMPHSSNIAKLSAVLDEPVDSLLNN